jgi:diaminopimelate decarboxylase
MEPGRSIIGQCGSLISRVLYVKNGSNTMFAIIDAGMTDLIRPALYQAHHKIENLTSKGHAYRYDVVGPVCESADTFGKYIELPETKRGDIIAIRSAGAYGEAMASRYNLRNLPGSVFSDDLK